MATAVASKAFLIVLQKPLKVSFLKARWSMALLIVLTSLFFINSCGSERTKEIGKGSLLYTNNQEEVEESVSRLFRTECGYTLLGEKPVSEEERPFFGHTDYQQEKKVREFLMTAFKNSPSFILRLPTDPNRCIPLTLIHKPALTRVINENEELKDFVYKDLLQ
jgi:hypothetical protein